METQRPKQVGPEPTVAGTDWRLRIGGLVEDSRELSADDLLAMPQSRLEGTGVRCPEGWDWCDSTWEGVTLQALIDLAHPQESARYVNVHAGQYVSAYRLESIPRREAMLALVRDGERLTFETGGPVRMVVGQGACFDMVKWVEALTFSVDGAGATVSTIVSERLPATAD